MARSVELVCLVGALVGCGTTSYERTLGRVAVTQGRVFVEVKRVEHHTTTEGGGPRLLPELRVPERTSDEVRGVKQLGIMEIDLMTGRCTRAREFPVVHAPATDARVSHGGHAYVAVPAYGVEERALDDDSLVATHSPFELVPPDFRDNWAAPVAWPVGTQVDGVTLTETATGVALEGSNHQRPWRVDLESSALPIRRVGWVAIGNGVVVNVGSGTLLRVPGRVVKVSRLKWTNDWLFLVDRPGRAWNALEGPYYTADETFEHLQRYRTDLQLFGVDRTTFVFRHPKINGLLTFDAANRSWGEIPYTCFPSN